MLNTSGHTHSKQSATSDLSMPSSKTWQATFHSDSTLFSGILPKSGMVSGGQLQELPPLERHTDENACSLLLPTPVASDTGNTPENHLRKKPGRKQVTSLRIILEYGLLKFGGRLPQQSGIGSESLADQLPIPLTPSALTPRIGVENLRLHEWMMGLPSGWVTGVPGVSRREAGKALGNGVVPQQAVAAIRHLLDARLAK